MATPTIYKTTTTSPSLDAPKGIAVDIDRERLLICDSGNNRLYWCYTQGIKPISTKSTYGANSFSNPTTVIYHKGFYYVADAGNHVVLRLDAKDLTYKDHFGTVGSSGSTNAKLNTPSGLATDGVYLYIADTGNNRIMKINLETFSYVAKTSNINGALSGPVGICYKREAGEALFIADVVGGRGRLIKCQTDFTYIEQNSSDLTIPQHIAYYNDFIFMCDGATGDDSILVFSSDGLTLTTSFSDSTATLSTPYGITVWRNILIIADSGNDRITAWKAYNPRDAFDQSTPAKFGGNFFDNPMIIVGEDSLIVGDTQESGTPNRWKEENVVQNSIGWVKES